MAWLLRTSVWRASMRSRTSSLEQKEEGDLTSGAAHAKDSESHLAAVARGHGASSSSEQQNGKFADTPPPAKLDAG